MTIRSYIAILLSLTCILTSCRKQPILIPVDYVSWIENPENELRIKREFSDYTFTLQYKPHEYVAIKEEGLRPEMKERFTSFLNDLGDLEYYTLSIEDLKGQDPIKSLGGSETDYLERFNYYSFAVQNDLKLISGTDTLDCVLAAYERNYSLSPFIKVLLAFPKSKAGIDKSIMFNDKYFGYGRLNFFFSSDVLTDLPKLKSE